MAEIDTSANTIADTIATEAPVFTAANITGQPKWGWTIEVRANDTFLLTNIVTKESIECQLCEIANILRK